MKITIDTKEDSHDEIRKIIGMLNSLVGAQEAIAEGRNEPELVQDDMFGMFSNNQEETAPAAETRMSSSEIDAMFSENREEQINVPEPEVIENIQDKLEKAKDYKIVPY